MQVGRCCCGPGGCDPVTGFIDEFNTFSYSPNPPAGTAAWKGILNDPGSQLVRVFPAGTLEVIEQAVFSGAGWFFDRCANWDASLVSMAHRLKGQYEAYEFYNGNDQGVSMFASFDSNQWFLTHALRYESGWRLQVTLEYDPAGPGSSATAQTWVSGILQQNPLIVPQGPWDFDLEVWHQRVNATQWDLYVTNFGNVILSVSTSPPNHSSPEWRHGFSSTLAATGFSAKTTRLDLFSYSAATA